MVSMRPVHTDMYLKVQTIRDGYRLGFFPILVLNFFYKNMSIFAFGVKNVLFVCIYFMKFHHFMICLYLSFLSCSLLILLLEHTEYEKMCTAPLRDYRW